MTLLRGLFVAVLLGGLGGCVSGAPERASDIQNLNAINDDIAAVSSARSSNTLRSRDPNLPGLFPRNSVTTTSYSP
jgi:hypothetical protein